MQFELFCPEKLKCSDSTGTYQKKKKKLKQRILGKNGNIISTSNCSSNSTFQLTFHHIFNVFSLECCNTGCMIFPDLNPNSKEHVSTNTHRANKYLFIVKMIYEGSTSL